MDRLAECAHRLVVAGFIARLHSTEAREKAVTGRFDAATTRWVSVLTSGKHAGYLFITWGRDDDLYSIARSLPGARYVKPGVTVPAGAVEAVADFADKYNFTFSKGAAKMLEMHRVALANGAVVTDIKERPAPVRVGYSSTPKPLAAPMVFDVDAVLLD